MSVPSTAGSASPSPQPRRVLRIVFLTLFIDLMGFSIIFPLFPSMLVHYRQTEAADSLFSALYSFLDQFSAFAGPADREWGILVLFGGILGSIYSLLQFICAPYLGSLSDRVGRRPVMLISLSGILVSYVLWFFAGNFALLLLSRFIGGVMSANISTASAIVADVTDEKNRSKGMAVIGIAFGLGFILGPAIGGISSLYNLAEHFPALAAYGVNPYSAPAAIAFLLTLFNVVSVAFQMPETLPPSEALVDRPKRSISPLALLQKERYPGVTRTNWTYFSFLLAFSGMEFSLTFLAADRLHYTPLQNVYMFTFVGIVLAFVQGSYVRRFSHRIGSKRMTVHGLIFLVPGCALIGAAGHWRSSSLLYLGLFLLGAGAAQATPCLSALVSLYSPAEEQGRIMGVFRSLGALARAVGPLIACVMYWRVGADAAYYLAAAFILLPLMLATTLPPVPETGAQEMSAA